MEAVARRACALWESVPQREFDMRNWDCGTTACAIGWLARLRIDGWRRPSAPWNDDCDSSLKAAASYFGVTLSQAVDLFGSPALAYDKPLELVTAADVAAALRAMPVTVPEECVAG